MELAEVLVDIAIEILMEVLTKIASGTELKA